MLKHFNLVRICCFCFLFVEPVSTTTTRNRNNINSIPFAWLQKQTRIIWHFALYLAHLVCFVYYSFTLYCRKAILNFNYDQLPTYCLNAVQTTYSVQSFIYNWLVNSMAFPIRKFKYTCLPSARTRSTYLKKASAQFKIARHMGKVYQWNVTITLITSLSRRTADC